MSNDLVALNAEMARAAAQYKEQEKIGEGRAITTRNGIFRIGSGDDAVEVPGNQLLTVVLDAVWANTYFDTRFSADNQTPPKCYAFGRNEDEMFPHIESMEKDMSYFMPQNIRNGEIHGCKTCPMAEWGSADTGRGKACSNRRKLALLPAGLYEREGRDWEAALYDDPRHFQTADIYTLSLPVTSVRGWSKYVQWLSTNHNRPPYGAVTRVFITPDTAHQFHIEFEFVELVQPEVLPAVFMRHGDVIKNKLLEEGYRAPSEDDGRVNRGAPQRRPAPRRGG